MSRKLCLKTEYQYLFINVGESQTRISHRDDRQRDPYMVVIMVIIMMMIIVSLYTLAGDSNNLRTQATSKLTSPSAVQFVQGYRLEYTVH
jgi:hypothetical protein